MLYHIIFASLFVTVVHSDQKCHICDSCSTNPTQAALCKCDADCGLFRDCCGSHLPPSSCPISQKNPLLPGVILKCQSIYLDVSIPVTAENEAFLMVSTCPSICSFDKDVSLMADNCTSTDLAIPLPPVTDTATGIVYKNEYCAYCNGVRELVSWQTDLACSDEVYRLLSESNYTMILEEDPDIIQRECHECSFRLPSLPLGTQGPRSCIPTISSCLPKYLLENSTGMLSLKEYTEMEKNCEFGVPDQVEGFNGLVYMNTACAACNAENITTCLKSEPHTQKCSPVNNTLSIKLLEALPTPFGISLSNVGERTGTTRGSTIINTNCSDGEVPVGLHCQYTQCPRAYSLTGGDCLGVREIPRLCNQTLTNCSSMIFSLNETGDIALYDQLGRPLACVNKVNCSSDLVSLDISQYTDFRNGSIFYEGDLTEMWYYDINLQVYICPDKKDDVLHYVSHTLSLVGIFLIILTYSLFSELRTLPGVIILNFSLAIFPLNFLNILFEAITRSQDPKLCASFAIFFHYSSLAQFTWINIFAYEILRKFYRGIHLKQDSRKTISHHLAAYMLLGWCPPLIVVAITVIINFTVKDLVDYGFNHAGLRCTINNIYAYLLAWFFPAAICCASSIIMFIIITIIICKLVKDKAKIKKAANWTLARLWIAIFTISGVTWLSYFVINQGSSRKWVHSLFLFLYNSHSLYIFLAFLLTKKVLTLYFNLFTCKTSSGSSSESTARKINCFGKKQQQQQQ